MKDERQQFEEFMFSARFMKDPYQDNHFIVDFLFRPRMWDISR